MFSLPILPFSLSIYEYIRRSADLMFQQVPTYYHPVIVRQSVFHFSEICIVQQRILTENLPIMRFLLGSS